MRELLKRTPLRLAAAFAMLFAATVVGLFAILVVSVGHELSHEIRQRVEQSLDALAVIDQEKGFDELATVVASESSTVRDADAIFLLVDKGGQFRAGNVRGVAASAGWVTVSRESLFFVSDKGDPGDTFFAKWRPVSGGMLLAGESNGEIRRTRELLIHGLGWGLAATLVLATLCGAFLASRAQGRIDAISSTLNLVANGALTSRIPLLGPGDDIDHVSGQINWVLGRIETLVENVNRTSSDIAHDLKRPIANLHQNLETAGRTAKDPAEFRAAIDIALSDLDQIVETFEAILSITQIEAGARKSRFSDVDLQQVLADVLDVYEAVAEDAGDTLKFSLVASGPANVRGDRDLLVQLLANLIENSIKHCPQGTAIELGLSVTRTGYVLSVTDNGPGIPASERSNVLRRHYRLDAARSTPGNGLGLRLVDAIAALHGAVLELGDHAPGLAVTIAFPKSKA